MLLDIEKVEKEKNWAHAENNKLKEKVSSNLKSKIKASNTWQESIPTLCSAVGVGLTVVVSVILPATGASCTIL